MRDSPRLLFWLDMLLLLLIMGLVLAGKWDYVIAVVIGLIVMNYFDHWRSRR